jgi:hypothetical protein
MSEELLNEGISRRKMLKRIGAGAAVAWSAPILTSIKTPAFAATPPPPPQCSGCAGCGPLLPCNNNSNCQCWQQSTDQGPGCTCTGLVNFCGDTPLCPGGQSECTDPRFPTCVETCCGRICTPPCGPQVRSKKGRSGAKTTR